MSNKMGIINALKPPGMTSFDIVNWIKKNLEFSKVGHTGTLDPRATGVLPVCIGKATKVIPHLPEDSKKYVAEITLGQVTETLDAEGETVKTSPNWKKLKKKDIVKTINKFVGDIKQIPPMYSAIKQNGKRLYKLARKGEKVERTSRKVRIEGIDILSIELPKIRININCGKGTYIRSLARDLGEELNCGAYLSFLIRTASGPFHIKDSYTIQMMDSIKQRNSYDFITPPDKPLAYKSLTIKKSAHKKAVNGAYLYPQNFRDITDFKDGENVLVYSSQGKFISISKIENSTCKPVRVFA